MLPAAPTDVTRQQVRRAVVDGEIDWTGIATPVPLPEEWGEFQARIIELRERHPIKPIKPTGDPSVIDWTNF